MQNVYILPATRTAIGTFGGSLKDVRPVELGRIVIAEGVALAGLELGDVGHVVMGQVMPTTPSDAYPNDIRTIIGQHHATE